MTLTKDTTSLADKVAHELGPHVPFDWLCVGITDPTTGMVTMVQDCTPIGPPEVYLATELLVPDVNKIAWLATQPDPVGVLSQATDGELTRSYRYRHALRPSGIEHELRAALVVDGMCWGYLVLLRSPDRPDFSPSEVQAVREAVPGLAADLRAGLLASAQSASVDATASAVAIVDDDGSLAAANTQAEKVFAELARLHPKVDLGLPVPVACVAASLRGPEAPEHQRALLSIPDGGWLVVEGHRVFTDTGGGRTVVTVSPARPMQLVPLLLQARGLTEREIEVAQCVLRGMSNAEIATHLAISAYTVQDHLKAVFAKTGARSRREFVTSVLPPADLAGLS